VVHQLEEEVLVPEDVAVVGRGLQRLGRLPQPQPGLHLAGRAAGGRDDAARVLGDQLAVHARLAVVALGRRERRQREQVPQAGRVGGDHRHVRVRAATRDVAAHALVVGAALPRLAPEHRLLVVAAVGCDVRLDADDRLDAGLLGGLVELVGPVHVAVVGHAHRGHAEPLRLGEQRPDLSGAVEHRVLGVHMQMNERVSRHETPPYESPTGPPRRPDWCVVGAWRFGSSTAGHRQSGARKA
jgi:hypothetical protein